MFRKFAQGLLYVIFKILYRIEVTGLDNIPSDGALIIYAKHTTNLDPIFVGCRINRMAYFMAKEELFRNKFFAAIITKCGSFPIKRGAKDLVAIKNSLAILEKGDILCMFPEGTRRKPGKEVKVKPGLAMIALKAECSVLPVAIIGEQKLFNKVKVVFGKPIDLSQHFDSEFDTPGYIKLSEELMTEIDKIEG